VFPDYLKPVSRFFRERRNRPLGAMIDKMQIIKGVAVNVLDVGGSIFFWLSVPDNVRDKCKISLVNLPGAYDGLPPEEEEIKSAFTLLTGDARNLSQFEDGSFDVVVCNSVIEHVGSWADMEAAANEAQRVGRHGWIQVPAFEFPLEQHFLIPFVHWFADPIQIRLLAALHGEFKKRSFFDQQMSVHHVRPLTRRQLGQLFPAAEIRSEWLILPKSHIATW
jgi:Methyltransferase domain